MEPSECCPSPPTPTSHGDLLSRSGSHGWQPTANISQISLGPDANPAPFPPRLSSQKYATPDPFSAEASSSYTLLKVLSQPLTSDTNSRAWKMTLEPTDGQPLEGCLLSFQ